MKKIYKIIIIQYHIQFLSIFKLNYFLLCYKYGVIRFGPNFVSLFFCGSLTISDIKLALDIKFFFLYLFSIE